MFDIGSLISSGINYFSQRETNESNQENVTAANAMNSSIAQENRDFQYKMWQEQTAYNSPTAQMTRLQAAGLNPNLVYGQIAESKMSNPPSTPIAHSEAFQADAPKVDVRLGNPVAEYAQVKNLQALNKLQNINIQKSKAEAVSAAVDADYKNYELNTLKNSGMIKGDSGLFRTIGRSVPVGGQLLEKGSSKLTSFLGDKERAHYLLNPLAVEGKRFLKLNSFGGR